MSVLRLGRRKRKIIGVFEKLTVFKLFCYSLSKHEGFVFAHSMCCFAVTWSEILHCQVTREWIDRSACMAVYSCHLSPSLCLSSLPLPALTWMCMQHVVPPFRTGRREAFLKILNLHVYCYL